MSPHAVEIINYVTVQSVWGTKSVASKIPDEVTTQRMTNHVNVRYKSYCSICRLIWLSWFTYLTKSNSGMTVASLITSTMALTDIYNCKLPHNELTCSFLISFLRSASYFSFWLLLAALCTCKYIINI